MNPWLLPCEGSPAKTLTGRIGNDPIVTGISILVDREGWCGYFVVFRAANAFWKRTRGRQFDKVPGEGTLSSLLAATPSQIELAFLLY